MVFKILENGNRPTRGAIVRLCSLDHDGNFSYKPPHTRNISDDFLSRLLTILKTTARPVGQILLTTTCPINNNNNNK